MTLCMAIIIDCDGRSSAILLISSDYCLRKQKNKQDQFHQ